MRFSADQLHEIRCIKYKKYELPGALREMRQAPPLTEQLNYLLQPFYEWFNLRHLTHFDTIVQKLE